MGSVAMFSCYELFQAVNNDTWMDNGDLPVETVGVINVAVLAPDVKDIAKVEDGSGLKQFKDMNKRCLLIQESCFLQSDSDSDYEDVLGNYNSVRAASEEVSNSSPLST